MNLTRREFIKTNAVAAAAGVAGMSVPDAQALAAYVGFYSSDEVEAVLGVAVENGTLVVMRRPDTKGPLTPVYADAFASPLGFVRFHRDAGGKVTGLSLVNDRVWDMRFERTGR